MANLAKIESRPLVVVLTGGIASGKSAVSDQFARMGVPVIDTDLLAREVVEPGKPALDKIVSIFGRGILLPDGRLDRAEMRSIVFADPAKRTTLERILHPAIHDEVQRRLKEVKSSYCILVIPLFTESSRYDWVDRVLVVDVPEEVQIQRVMARDTVDRAHAEAILRAQASRAQRLAITDDVVVNTSGLEELEEQVLALHELYLNLAEKKVRKELES